MLGITVADAVLVGTLLVSLLAAWRGGKDGGGAAKAKPPLGPEYAIMGATMVDTETFRDVAAAVRELSAILREGIHAQQDAANAKLLGLMEQIRDAMSQPPPAPPRPPRRQRRG